MNTENNKIIREFHPKMKVDNGIGELTEVENLRVECLRYHSDWNWLMEVVEKIKKVSNEDDFLDKLNTLNSRISIELENQLESCFRKSYLSIEQVYNACVEFIKWYNKQK